MALEQRLFSVVLAHDEDLVFLRQRNRDVASLFELGEVKTTRLSTALSEIARRALRFGGGRVRFGCRLGERAALVVQVEHGSRSQGVEEPEAEEETPTPSVPTPHGFEAAAALVDGFEVDENDGTTCIELRVDLPSASSVDAETLRAMTSELARRTPGDPVAELKRQNHEIMTTLERLQRAERMAARAAVERETILELVPIIVWTARPNGRRDYFSPRWEETTGIRAASARGEGWLAAVHSKDRESTAEGYEAGIASGVPFELEWCMVCADGRRCWHAERAVPIRDSAGEIAKWYGTTANIDERRRREQEAARTSAFLKRMVSVVGHDLRAPLAVVSAATELLEGRLDDQVTKSVVGRLRNSTARASRMIDDLLDYTRAELGGGIVAERRRCDLRPALVDLIQQADIAHPNHRLETHLPESLEGHFDADRVVQAVSNLVENATAHADPSHPIILAAKDLGEDVYVEVRNRGPVVPSDVIETIFEPFQRRGTSAKNRKGLGLGLYIVAEIAKSHGGTATIASDAKRGTRVGVTLSKSPRASSSRPAPMMAGDQD